MKKIIIALCVVICVFAIGWNSYQSQKQNVGGKKKVYAILPLTGTYSQGGKEEKKSLETYINVNSDIPFEVQFLDNESNPTKSLTLAQRVAMNDKSPLFICSVGALCRPLLPQLKQMNGFMILSPSTQEEKTTVKEFQRISINHEEMNSPHIDYLQPGRNVVIIHSNEEAGYTGASLVASQLQQKGVNVVGKFDFAPSELDVRILVLKALKDNPDAILIISAPNVGFINLIKVLKKEQNYQGDVLCDPSMQTPSVMASFGDEKNDILVPVLPTERTFAEYPQTAKAITDAGLTISNYPIMMWDVMDIIRHFIDNKIEFSQDAFVKMKKWHGISTDVIFSPNGNSSYKYVLTRIKDGKFVPVNEREEK